MSCSSGGTGESDNMALEVDLNDPKVERLAQIAERLVPGGAEKWKAEYLEAKKCWATRVMGARKAGIDEKTLLDLTLPQPTIAQRKIMMYEVIRLRYGQDLEPKNSDDVNVVEKKMEDLNIPN